MDRLMRYVLLALAGALLSVAPVSAQNRVLPSAQVDGSGNVRFPNGPTLGKIVGGVFKQTAPAVVPTLEVTDTPGTLTRGNQNEDNLLFAGKRYPAMVMDWTLNDQSNATTNNPTFPANDGRMWNNRTYSYFAVARKVTDALLPDNYTLTDDRPWMATFSRLQNDTTPAKRVNGVAHMSSCLANNGGNSCFAYNGIAWSADNAVNPKLVGAELDIQFKGTDTAAGVGSAGLYINVFGPAGVNPGSAIQFNSHNGAKWANGVVCADVIATGGCLVGADGATIGSLVNSGSATYANNAPIILNNGHKQAFYDTNYNIGGAAKVGTDGAFFKIIPPANNLVVFRDHADITNAATIAGNGDITATGGVTATGGLTGAFVNVTGTLRSQFTATPANASAACTQGTQLWDANYFYVCVATNTWKRAALSSW